MPTKMGIMMAWPITLARAARPRDLLKRSRSPGESQYGQNQQAEREIKRRLQRVPGRFLFRLPGGPGAPGGTTWSGQGAGSAMFSTTPCGGGGRAGDLAGGEEEAAAELPVPADRARPLMSSRLLARASGMTLSRP